MALSFYEEFQEGIDAQNELIDARSVSAASKDDVDDLLEQALQLIENGSGPKFDTRPWGVFYLLEKNGSFGFLRHAPDATTEWLFLMFGIWMQNSNTQIAEATRRMDASERL